VHCFQGISRSATIICAYVIATAQHSMTATEAVEFVQGKRKIVCPNLGFRVQLEEYAIRFVGRRDRKGSGKGSRISSGIAERIRRLRTGNSLDWPSPDGKASTQEI
jgi:atypical dual specificity phosphatase